MARRFTGAPQGPLAAEVLTLLAGGWDVVKPIEGSSYDYVNLFNLGDQDQIDLYDEHRTLVDAEARRLGRERPAINESIAWWRSFRTDLRFPAGLAG